MSIHPKILARMKEPPQDNGQSTEYLLEKDEADMPALRGTSKQIEWGKAIRTKVMKLTWPPVKLALFKLVDDATWWIANRRMVVDMKYKPPSKEQLVRAACAVAAPRQSSAVSLPRQSERVNDAAAFAASVSRHPLQAETAVLALLAKLYKGTMHDELKALAKAKRQQAEFEIERDMKAIDKLLA